MIIYYFAEVEDDWNLVIRECKPLAAKWECLSAYLGMKSHVIEVIKKKRQGEPLACLNEALMCWIKQEDYNTKKFGEPSWKTLLKAVAEINKLLFKKLAKRHQHKGICMLYIHDNDINDTK